MKGLLCDEQCLHQFCTLHDVTTTCALFYSVYFYVVFMKHNIQTYKISNPEQNLYLSPKTFIRRTKRKSET